MITKVNPYGSISLTNEYFSGLVAQAAKNCYGAYLQLARAYFDGKGVPVDYQKSFDYYMKMEEINEDE